MIMEADKSHREISNVYFLYLEHNYNLTHFEAWSSHNNMYLCDVFKILLLLG